jgi:uncharacterized membrane protein YphA (DoxX/SURF4 family)
MVYAIDFSQEGNFKPAKFSNLGILLNQVLPLLTTGAALVFLFIMLLAGFKILTHGDNPDEIKKAQQTIGFALLGLIIVILAFLIVRLIGAILKVDNILPT